MTSVVIETTAPKYSESKSSKPGLKKKCLVHSFKVWSYKHVGVEWEGGSRSCAVFDILWSLTCIIWLQLVFSAKSINISWKYIDVEPMIIQECW